MKQELLQKLKYSDKSPKYYQYYSRLFLNYFINIDAKYLDDLYDAGYIYYQSILLIDELIDTNDYSNLPLILFYQEETIKLLTSIYGMDSDFWEYWQERKNEYFKAVQIEKKMNIYDVVEFEIYEDLADKKSAFGKIAIDSLYILSKHKKTKEYEILLKSHKYFSVGFQLYDDVKDFKEDFINKQFNWAIYMLNKKINFSEYNNDVNILNKLLYIENVGQKLLQESINYFQKSLVIISDLKVVGEWEGVIIKMKQTIEKYLDTTNGYIEVIQKKIELHQEYVVKDYFFDFSEIDNKTIKKGLHYIKKDFLNNFSELKHIMYLSNKEGFINKERVHYSDTFQRAILNDCLFDISEKYNLNTLTYFKTEIDYLLSRKNNDSVGGWSYFPTVKEIAADIDDLGQIMQFFFKINNNLIKNYCLNPINICLSDRISQNGGVETWIIPKINQTEFQKKQETFNYTKWGKGPDVEVVANFIYSLELYNSNLYKKIISNSIIYILKEQNENGYWESRWYYGNYYGTYICLKLLKKYNNKYSNQIRKAINYIINNQKNDGGFSSNKNQKSEALSTAFALLSLKLFLPKTDSAIVKAESYLIKTQNSKGFWNESDFIKPKIHEPYKSKTLTTAIVLKSLCYE